MSDPSARIHELNFQNDCGTNELFDAIIHEYHSYNTTFETGGLNLPFDAGSLRVLLKKAYAASLLAEEGRYPRLRIILGSEQDSLFPFDSLVRFQTPVVISDANDLRRLAPAVAEPNCALRVAEGGEDARRHLECLGIVDADKLNNSAPIGTPAPILSGEWIVGETTYVMLGIEGPGNLRARFAGTQAGHVLRGGRIRRRGGVPLMGAMLNLHIAAPHGDSPPMRANQILPAWSRVLETANSKRHGAAFIVLPEMDVTIEEIRTRYRIESGYDVRLDLGKALVELRDVCDRFWKVRTGESLPGFKAMTHPQQVEHLANEWNSKRRDLFVMQNVVAGLSGVDGCVVLDRSLKVHLFGGKIKANSDREKMPLHAPGSGMDLLPQMDRLGTRNNSACDFCREHPGAFAFVLSQDSDLRVYWSDQSWAFALLDLDTHMK